MPINIVRNFIKLESKSSVLLLFAAFIAITIANSPLNEVYVNLLNYPIIIEIADFQLITSIRFIVNEGLMTLFFLLISLEVKRGLLSGELDARHKALLPFIASMGGILIAALVFLIINQGITTTQQGWAIPTATDVAFSSAILMLLGRSVPASLKLFLITLAIVDDLGAIVIISLFYTHQPNIIFLLLAILCFLLLLIFNRRGVVNHIVYGMIGILLWLCVIKSNINPPIAGVLLGFTIPLKSNRSLFSPLEQLENKLHPWVVFGILPVFAFVNAGLSLSGIPISFLFHPLTVGIALGLFLGKQLGIFMSCWLAVKTKIAKLPSGANWRHMYGLSVICGIGFTMNLFIGFLAFPNNPEFLNLVKLGVFSGSLISGMTGYLILKMKH